MSESESKFVKKRAPTLYAIIAFKLIKGTLLLLVGLGVYHIADKDLPELFQKALLLFHLDPEKKFFVDLAERIDAITQARMVWVASGTVLYSLFSLVEGSGLIFRVSWSGWMAIGESAFFIPIEVFELLRSPSVTVFLVLVLNVIIFWYLLQNRHRLFRHHHSHHRG